jgi:hypothetical protein
VGDSLLIGIAWHIEEPVPSNVFACFADWERRVSLNHVAKIRKW